MSEFSVKKLYNIFTGKMTINLQQTEILLSKLTNKILPILLPIVNVWNIRDAALNLVI